MRYSWRGWPMTLPLHHFYEIITIDGSKANTNSFRHRKPSPLQHTKQNSTNQIQMAPGSARYRWW